MSANIHLVGISGSLRKGSYNTALLRAAQELLPWSRWIHLWIRWTIFARHLLIIKMGNLAGFLCSNRCFIYDDVHNQVRESGLFCFLL